MESILRKELKQWQRDFRAKHGRDPTKRDILQHPEIASTYDTWNAIAAVNGGTSKTHSSSGSSSRGDDHGSAAVAGPSRLRESASRKDASQSRRGEAAAPLSKRRKEEEARRQPHQQRHGTSTSGMASTTPESVFKTPTKPKNTSDRPATGLATPTQNPFRTPTKLGQASLTSPSSFRTPKSKHGSSASAGRREAVSPTGSIVDVQMTPTKSPSVSITHATSRDRYDYAASPSRLRMLVASHSVRSPNGKRLAINDPGELITYTPRTKARKRLRGEDVPPTPKRDGGSLAHKRESGGVFAAYLASAKEGESTGLLDQQAAGEAAILTREAREAGKAAGGLAGQGFGSLGKKPATFARKPAFGPSGGKSKSLGSVLGLQRPSPLEQGTRMANGVLGEIPTSRKQDGETSGHENGESDNESDDGNDPLQSSPSKAARSGRERRAGPVTGAGAGRSLARPLERSASAGSHRSFKPLFASPFGNHAPVKLPLEGLSATKSGASSSGGLFAAELEARKRSGGLERRRSGGASSEDGEDDDTPSSSIPLPRRRGRTSSPSTDLTTPSSAAGDPELIGHHATPQLERRPQRQPSWKISTIVLSEDEEDAGGSAQREAKTITVLPYQRYGSLRNKVQSLNRTESHSHAMALDDDSHVIGQLQEYHTDEDEEDAHDDLFSYALNRSPRRDAFARPPLEAGEQVKDDTSALDSSSDSEPSDPTHDLVLSALSLHSPRRRRNAGRSSSALPVQARNALRAQRLSDAKHLQALLGAGRDELEVLRIEEEMQSEQADAGMGTGKAAKTWGEAKSRSKPEPTKGKGRTSAGRTTKKDIQQALQAAAAESAELERQRRKRRSAFSRAGRSGLGADEDGDERESVLWRHFDSDGEGDEFEALGRPIDGHDRAAMRGGSGRKKGTRAVTGSDEDWASEVESDEYGLGDGRMDEFDVV